MEITKFFNTDFGSYAGYDNYRKIGSFVDGLKPSARKCIYTILQKNITTKVKIERLKSSIADYCLTGDTLICLYNDEYITLDEWANKFKNVKLPLKSFDEESKSFVKGIGHSPRKTKSVNTLIEIEMENGEIFKCTEDHKFLVKRNGSNIYIEAKHLNDDDELISLDCN